MRRSPPLSLLLAILSAPLLSHAFYLPGVAPKAFPDGEVVNLKVQTLVSPDTPLQFDYYQLPFCKPAKVTDLPENLGEALAGDKAHTSAFNAIMKVDEYCKTLCRKQYTGKQMEEFGDFAVLEYRANMRVDSMPLSELERYEAEDGDGEGEETYNLGYPIGTRAPPSSEDKSKDPATSNDEYVLNNHLRFRILYHPSDDDDQLVEGGKSGSFIVGFHVEPMSVKHSYRVPFNESAAPYVPLTTCSKVGADDSDGEQKKGPVGGLSKEAGELVIDTKEGNEVVWTYDVIWEYSDVKWASRWDAYLTMKDDDIHWFSIVNSLVIVFFLSCIIALVMARVLRKDFARYNEQMSPEDKAEAMQEMREETGWKLVSSDVFRPPPSATLLSVYLGSGMQVFIMTVLTLCLAAMGFLSPANRGSLLTAVLFSFVLMGVPAGYVSARYCKLVKEPNHFKATLLTAVMLPGVIFIVFFIINAIAWSHQSSSAVPFGTLVVLMLLWFCISLPLIFFGAYLGFNRDTISVPIAPSALPREIKEPVWYMKQWVSMLVGGVLPFGAVFVEMFFILSSIWQHRFYYMFGFLALVFVMLVVTCAEVSIVLCYLHLCSEDYRWWWRSFMTSGSTAFYIFAYSLVHYAYRAPTGGQGMLAGTLFVGYMFILCYALFVLTGFIGFTACFHFVKKIYSSIKIE